MNRAILPTGIFLFGLGILLAFFIHSQIWYTPFLIGGFLIFEYINSNNNFSVLYKTKRFIYVWGVLILITVVIEYIGMYILRGWSYPSFNEWKYFIHVILIGYPFTFFFALELFVFLKKYLSGWWFWISPFIAIIFGYINEIPNLWAYEWRYREMIWGNIIGIPILISILWIMILAVQIFEKYFWKSNKKLQ